MQEDTFLTVAAPSEAVFTSFRSKFLSFVIPISSVENVKTYVDNFRKKYYDARHVCYAYTMGADQSVYRANDDGEPSGTAGKPILGQIYSKGLTNVLVVVVRYFGGVKLGTSGLIAAYKAVAAAAIAEAEIVERTVDERIGIAFTFESMNDVMRIVKEESPQIVSQDYDTDCRMELQIRRSRVECLRERLMKVETLRFT
ncbi:MAG: YigZ family protein [Prevotellaceae bacterium]|jgi:uncharacterized YigZ family protein|nr:YigZ family protein [Prevotellaceae bacterium]